MYEKWNNTSSRIDHQVSLNGDFELDSDWDLTLNVGATSIARTYD